MKKDINYDFSGLSDIDLVFLQYKAEKYPEDKKFKEEVLKELGRREKKRNNNA